MPERENVFPQRMVLNGIDYFLLQLDRIMFRSSGCSNVCTFVVDVQERLDGADLAQNLSLHPGYQWIMSLRLKTGLPFALPTWVVDQQAKLPEIEQYLLFESEHMPDHLLASTLDVVNDSAFKIVLLQLDGAGSRLIFTWHHALMDAHGGEIFIHYLGNTLSSQSIFQTDTQKLVLPFLQRAKIAGEMKRFLYEISELPLFSLYQHYPPDKISLCYKTLSFSAQQTLLINTRAREHGAGFMRSAFYQAVTLCAVANVQQQRGTVEQGDMLVPVPQDRRLRGAQGPVIGNQVTFLFYRIPKAALSGLQTCTTELVKQMTALMRSDNPTHYLIMMDLLRYVPGPLYRFLLKQPTAGLMGSFFYSDTGDSLKNFSTLFERTVTHAVHYPPNVYPPGITFVFSRFRGGLQITIGYMQQMIDEAEMQQLLADLRFGLLGEDAVSVLG